MPVLCDFNVILGDETVALPAAGNWDETFNTGGRRSGGLAFLMLMVKGLTATTTDVPVKINDKTIGYIIDSNGANANHWFTQIINIGGSNLNDGNNEISITAGTDAFSIRDVICFFQQSS